MKTIKILRVLGRLWPIVREFVVSLDRDSDGGKRITPNERDRIIDVTLNQAREELDRYATGR